MTQPLNLSLPLQREGEVCICQRLSQEGKNCLSCSASKVCLAGPAPPSLSFPGPSADHRELRRAGTAQISEFKPRGGNARGVRQIRLCCKHEAVALRAQLGVELGGWQGVVCFCNHGAARAQGMGGGRADRSRGEAGKAAWPQHCPPVLQGCRGGASKTSLLLQGGTFT